MWIDEGMLRHWWLSEIVDHWRWWVFLVCFLAPFSCCCFFGRLKRVGKMAWRNEIVMRDVSKAGLVISNCISREVVAQLDLEEALEASRYASHPYTAQPREVILVLFHNYYCCCYYHYFFFTVLFCFCSWYLDEEIGFFFCVSLKGFLLFFIIKKLV